VGLIAAVLVCGVALAGVMAWAAAKVLAAFQQTRRDAERSRLAQLVAAFGPGAAAAANDPHALLVWFPLAQTARGVLPEEFAMLDKAAGRTFPFSREQVEAAHAAWTASWLAWERAHDAEYKLKVQALAESLGSEASTLLGRSRLDALEREKVERYQQRYEEYTRIAKALQRLSAS
jgi:hypothetical protein